MMRVHSTRTCTQHDCDFGCPDVLVLRVKRYDTWWFSIPIRDCGMSHVPINNCPWCGKELNVHPTTVYVDAGKKIGHA